jgi:hypothetical protein
MNEEVLKELKYFMKGVNDPLHIVGNFPHLIDKCYQVGEQIPEEAWKLFGEALNKLGRAWQLVELIRSL